MKLKNKTDIPSDWKVLNVRKKTSVKIRPCNGVEQFKVAWSNDPLTSDPDVDLIVISNGSEYPCKRDIFNETYVPVEPKGSDSMFDYSYVKNVQTQIVEIPEGVEVELETLEGTIGGITFPCYVAIGAKGELYHNGKDFVDDNLEILSVE